MKVCHKGATSSGRRCATRMMVKANNNAKVAKVAGVAGVAVTAGTTLAAQVRRREPTHTDRDEEGWGGVGGVRVRDGRRRSMTPRAETPPASSCCLCWGPTRLLRERLSSTLLPPRHESIATYAQITTTHAPQG